MNAIDERFLRDWSDTPPGEGDVVVSLERMNRIEEIHALEGVMQVQVAASVA